MGDPKSSCSRASLQIHTNTSSHRSAMSSDDTPLPIPDISVQQHLFTLLSPKASSAQQAHSRDAILAAVRKDKMAPYYASLFANPLVADSGLLKQDAELLKELQLANEQDLKDFDDEEKKNEEEEGELEVTAVKRKRAIYLAQIGDKDKSLEALKALSTSPSVGIGSRIDLAMTQIRVGLFFGDAHVTSQSIEQTRA